MSNSVQPQRWQPTRLPRPCPWDSPGKNNGMGCHFLLQCMKVKSESEVAQSCPNLSDPMDCSLAGSSNHGIFQARILECVASAFSSICMYITCILYMYIHIIYVYYMYIYIAQLCPTLCKPMDYSPPGSPVHGIFSSKNTGVGCYFLFQGIFPTQGWNPGLPHCRQTPYHLSHQRIPYIYVYIAPYGASGKEVKNPPPMQET